MSVPSPAHRRWLRPLRGRWGGAVWVLVLALAGGCDAQRLAELQPGTSTEADVRSRMGEPSYVWDDGDGARSLEYTRQPAGQVNYMVRIGPDGRMRALQQVLEPSQFARVLPGMRFDEVQRLLGQPAGRETFALQPGVVQAFWRYLEPPSQARLFTVVFGTDGRVQRTLTGEDTTTPEQRGGR